LALEDVPKTTFSPIRRFFLSDVVDNLENAFIKNKERKEEIKYIVSHAMKLIMLYQTRSTKSSLDIADRRGRRCSKGRRGSGRRGGLLYTAQLTLFIDNLRQEDFSPFRSGFFHIPDINSRGVWRTSRVTAGLVCIDEFILQSIDFPIEIVLANSILRDFQSEILDLGSSTLFCHLEFWDSWLHEVVDEFEFHNPATNVLIRLTEVIDFAGWDGGMVIGTLVMRRDDGGPRTAMRRVMSRGFNLVERRELWGIVSGRRRLTQETCSRR
jgi:hypothetical protein